MEDFTEIIKCYQDRYNWLTRYAKMIEPADIDTANEFRRKAAVYKSVIEHIERMQNKQKGEKWFVKRKEYMMDDLEMTQKIIEYCADRLNVIVLCIKERQLNSLSVDDLESQATAYENVLKHIKRLKNK